MSPTLSICIPTFNRAELLASALGSLAPQVGELGGEVELVVSDNCSADHTREVVERARRQCPALRYHRNEENVGGVRNVLGLVRNLAVGEFCWLMGDDELVRDGGVRKVLQAIKGHPDLDYFYVNYSMDSFERREGIAATAEDFREWTMTGNPNLSERRVERWETLIAEDFNGLTPLYASVFRRSMWLGVADRLRVDAAPYTSVDQTYPQALVFARTMVGKPAWSSGHPWVVMCGKESWADFVPAVVLLRFHELLDAYVRNGVDGRLVEGHRRRMLSHAAEPLARVLRGERLALLESFSVGRFVLRHVRYRETWEAVFSAVVGVPARLIARRSLPLAALALPAKALLRCRMQWGRMRTRLNF